MTTPASRTAPRSAGGRKPISLRLRFAVLSADGFRCHYCGRRAPSVLLQVEHIIPVAAGGTNDRDNLVASCSSCNLGKSDRPLSVPNGHRWEPIITDRSVPGRCPGDIHNGEWTEYAIKGEGYPAEVALVCSACRYIVAKRPLVAA